MGLTVCRVPIGGYIVYRDISPRMESQMEKMKYQMEIEFIGIRIFQN